MHRSGAQDTLALGRPSQDVIEPAVRLRAGRGSAREACLVRFRPIMMTTLAALLGTLPSALGTGAGGESRPPLGVAVVGGLLFSQMLTSYVTPVFHLHVEDFRHWLGRVGGREPVARVGAGVDGCARRVAPRVAHCCRCFCHPYAAASTLDAAARRD